MNPTALVILDGFGHRSEKKYNAIAQAKKPTYDYLIAHFPHTYLVASGSTVGLPQGYAGNSEVGHITIGAGHIVPSAFLRLHTSIEDGSLFTNPILSSALSEIAQTNHTVHILGILSDAGVQGHQEIIYALIQASLQWHVKKIVIHAFLDGRDTPPKSAALYLNQLQEYVKSYPHAIIGSITGRYYAMDRDNHWDRTQKAYDVLVKPGMPEFSSWQEALAHYYSQSITDEYIPPTLLAPQATISSNDGIIFANFREDRARQLAACFIYSDKDLDKFSSNPSTRLRQGFAGQASLGPLVPSKVEGSGRTVKISARGELVEPFEHYSFPLLFFISAVRYSPHFTNPVLLEIKPIPNTLKERLSKEGKTLFSIAETEKYAHITYFIGGGREKPFPHEKQILIHSLPLKSYAENPQMSAQKITDAVLQSLQKDPQDFYLINYANADMVGHSGNLDATIQAIECLDKQLAQLYEQIVVKMNGTLIITADHGNAELLFDEKTGQPHTAHATNKVPFILVKNQLRDKKIDLPLHELANIAPFILKDMLSAT